MQTKKNYETKLFLLLGPKLSGGDNGDITRKPLSDAKICGKKPIYPGNSTEDISNMKFNDYLKKIEL